MTTGAAEILAEREKQELDWGDRHDDRHDQDELAYAAISYILADSVPQLAFDYWPWDDDYWKPKTRRENLVRAGALIAAEIDRLDRLEKHDE